MTRSRHLLDDLAVHSLGANDGRERDALDIAIRAEPDLREAISDFDSVTEALLESFGEATPPTAVWESIESRIHGNRTTRPVPWLWMAAVASVAILVMVAAVLPTRQAVTAAELASDLMADPTSAVRELVDPDTGVPLLTVVSAGDGAGYAVSTSLPALDETQTYQLWSVVGGEVVSVGLLGPDPAAIPLRLESDPGILAVTVEASGGVAVSEAVPVAVWTPESTS